ncbi:MAG: carboxypeptidase regulatory-like domain-containing protein [Acidobacteria bacterium]|nr:carboxypeptidase regulatory-like domain-containing protein [Acidobacteriota bacterium]
MRNRVIAFGLMGLALAAFLAATVTRPAAQAGDAPRVDNDDIGGVVTGPRGPEAGVWVIAETTDLPTKMAKVVVTDDRGRYVIPDLPKATYSVWVRGYGLVDSAKVTSAPGRAVNLSATPAPTPRAAAEYYPANYWYALMQPPDRSEFPGTGARGNGISEAMRSQAMWINNVKTSTCTPCHQMGNKATREIPAALGKFPSSVEAWNHRLQVGIDGGAGMYANTNRFGRERVLKMFADWTDRVAGGELPAQAPPRPTGVERNFVITVWDWASDREYFHDAVASDKRNPFVNQNGPVYGLHENSSDHLTILDPMQHKSSQLTIPVVDEKLLPLPSKIGVASPYWGEEIYWSSRTIGHSNVMDHRGRTWNTTRTRPPAMQPDFCKEGSSHPSAKHFPLNTSGRQYTVHDPKTNTWTVVNTCFGTFHLNFAHDADNTIWSGEGGVVGWVNTKILDAGGDQQKAQGWAPLVLDTNGNGRQDAWVEPDQAVDPAKDKRIDASFYGIAVSPVDGSVWGDINAFPGAAVRVVPGPNPPQTTIAEIYEIPYGNAGGQHVYNPRGIDVDANGVFWTVLASGQYASFDRRKCKAPLNGPNATGKHCPEGWAFYQVPGPNFKGNPESGAADSNYYNWVDKYDTLGAGKNVPIATGNLSDALLILQNGKWVVMRVPYPMGFFVKQIDGRIDDPRAGWKGKGLWTTSANRTPWHMEGGKGTLPKVYKIQMRPDPLAR